MSVIKQIDKALAGAPNHVLTIILFVIAAIAVLIALYGTPSLKIIAASWFIAP